MKTALAVLIFATLAAVSASASDPGWRWVTPHGVATFHEGTPLTVREGDATYVLTIEEKARQVTIERKVSDVALVSQ